MKFESNDRPSDFSLGGPSDMEDNFVRLHPELKDSEIVYAVMKDLKAKGIDPDKATDEEIDQSLEAVRNAEKLP